MKKIIISILTAFFLILSGCYKGDDKATVRISFNNLPVAKNFQPKTFLDRVRSFFVKDAFAADPDVYIAAMKDDNALLKVSLYSSEIINNTVELEVPAGDDITILVVTTNSSSEVNYYGYNIVNLEAGKTQNVNIQMDESTWCEDACTYKINPPIDTCASPLITRWESPDIKLKFYLKDMNANEIIYEGFDKQAQVNQDTTYQLFVEFVPFDLQTAGPVSEFTVGGC